MAEALAPLPAFQVESYEASPQVGAIGVDLQCVIKYGGNGGKVFFFAGLLFEPTCQLFQHPNIIGSKFEVLIGEIDGFVATVGLAGLVNLSQKVGSDTDELMAMKEEDPDPE